MENTQESAIPAENTATESTETVETPETTTETKETEAIEAKVDADPSLSKAEKQEIKKNLKKFKLKVDGREFEEEIDLNDEENLKKELQLSKVAQKRMNEKATIEKQVANFFDDLLKNPRKVLSDPALGIDLKKMAAEIIEDEIKNSQKSPEQLEKEKLQAELQKLKADTEKEKKEFREKELERLQAAETERYDMLMTKALEKSDLPKSPYVVKKMADYLIMGLESGNDVSPEDVLPLVREEIQNDLREMFAAMPDEVIEKVIGKDVFTRMRKKNLARAKEAVNKSVETASSIKDVGSTEKTEKEPEKKQSFREFFGV